MIFNEDHFSDKDELDGESEEGYPSSKNRICQSSMNSKSRDRNDKNDTPWLMDIRNEKDWNSLIDSKAISYRNLKVTLKAARFIHACV